MPISDYCIVALSSFDNKGIGSSIGYNDNYSVLNPKDEQSKTLNKLAQIINDDNRNINMLLPIGDGLMICIKNSS